MSHNNQLSYLLVRDGVRASANGIDSNTAASQQCFTIPSLPKSSGQFMSPRSLNYKEDICTNANGGSAQLELLAILKEIRVITNKIRAEVYFILFLS